MSDAGVEAVLRYYPQIFLACHLTHPRASSSSGLSDRDSMVLGHLSERIALTASQLARHLGIGASSLSAILSRLARLELVERRGHAEDGRIVELRLTAKGKQAIRESSVLDAERVAQMLARLSSSERRAALQGLTLLARAARELTAVGRTTDPSGRTP